MTIWLQTLGALASLGALAGWQAWRATLRGSPATPSRPVLRWPALRLRSRSGWCGLDSGETGYGPAQVAVVNCRSQGEQNRLRYQPARPGSCEERQLRHGGERACAWACLGAGDCEAVCPVAAIRMEAGLPLIDAARCTGCGDCVLACPRQVISLIPAEAQLLVGCHSGADPGERPALCDTACAGSAHCLDTRFLSPGLVSHSEGRPVLHHDRSANLLPLLSLCPSGTFVDRIPHRPWFTVNDHCTGCGDCLPRCPEPGCILPAGEPAATPVGTRRVRIVPEACTGCGLCLPACPPQAIRVVGALGYGRVGSQVL